jgi:hypothetical protein
MCNVQPKNTLRYANCRKVQMRILILHLAQEPQLHIRLGEHEIYNAKNNPCQTEQNLV